MEAVEPTVEPQPEPETKNDAFRVQSLNILSKSANFANWTLPQMALKGRSLKAVELGIDEWTTFESINP